jgi:hypothetical protein
MAAALYYGWPIIEALFIILPIPDPSGAMKKLTGFFASIFESIMNAIPFSYAVLGMIQTILSPFTDMLPNRGNLGGNSNNDQGFEMGPGYSSNLDAQPEAFMEDDDSDEDVGRQKDDIDLNYDSDEKSNDEDLIGISKSTEGTTELISLDGSSSGSGKSGAAKNIPKLQGPK